MLIVLFAGCGKKESKKVFKQNENLVKVQIDSDPESAFVLIDRIERGVTPLVCEIEAGTHTLSFLKKNYCEVTKNSVNIDKNHRTVTAKLTPVKSYDTYINQGGQSEIVFDSVPVLAVISLNGYFPYSGIFYGGAYTISGKASIDWFDIVFPSGKKVRFDVAETGGEKGKFSKIIKFNETGEYAISTNTGHKYTFNVSYKVTILPPTRQVKDIFPETYYKNAIAVPLGKETEAKILVTDAAKNPIKNKPLGVFGLKTDNNGIVKFRVKITRDIFNSASTYKMYINGKLLPSAQSNIYADLLAIPYGIATFTKTGRIIGSTVGEINSDVNAVSKNGKIYVPYDFLGDCGMNFWFGINCDVKNTEIVSSANNPSVIYTCDLISWDGGAHWENTYSFQTIAANPEKPNVIYGYSFSNPFGASALFKSVDYGKHFIPVFEPKGIITQIAVNEKRVYLVSPNGLFLYEDGVKTLKCCAFYKGEVKFVAANPENPDELFVSSSEGLFKTTDNCKTFEKIAFPEDAGTVICMATGENTRIIYAGTPNGLYVSTNFGKKWNKSGNFRITGKESIAVDPAHSNIVYVFDEKRGVYKSLDYGKHFIKIGFPVNAPGAGITVNGKGELLANAQCIPLKFENGKFFPMGSGNISKNAPIFKTINGKFFISINSINLPDVRGIIREKTFSFYVLYTMLP